MLRARRFVPPEGANAKTGPPLSPLLESLVLYLLARENPRPEPICELGSMLGGSTIALALGTSRSRHAPRVIAIDDHEWHQHLANAARPEAVAALPSTLPRFQDNLKRARLKEMVEIVIGDTAASGRSYDGELSMLFVDGDHSLLAVRADLAAWLPKVMPGGVVGFHDYGNPLWPDVRRAVDERLKDLSGLSVLQTLAVAHPRRG
jgi:MMP 1-O-methyltransferase